MRILNGDMLTSHGNVRGRQAMLEILEAGLQAADPYPNTRALLRIEGNRLIVGKREYEPLGDPRAGDAIYDLSQGGRIFVFGAGKGVQRLAKAIEDVLGERLTGGHVIAKKGDDLICERIGVTFGQHPVPDEDCVRGCEIILSMTRDLRPEDLVFTVVSNGVSSLLTLPVPGISLEDVRRTTYIMQIERGAPTGDLNPIRNHLDQMKAGRLATYLHPARAIHIFAFPPSTYERLMHHNVWLHSLPGSSTFADAIANLKKWDAWDAVPQSVRDHLLRADPTQETVKAATYEKLNFRIFGVMPPETGMVPTAMRKAEGLGFRSIHLAEDLRTEAGQTGPVIAAIARTIERCREPFVPPCALFTHGELVVTVGQAKGMGGRNQEYALSAALGIAGSERIIVGSVDSDGTDGPAHQFVEGLETVPALAGGIVDGYTVQEAAALGIDIRQALTQHNTSPALWALKSGIVATRNISMNDLSVTLILGDTARLGEL